MPPKAKANVARKSVPSALTPSALFHDFVSYIEGGWTTNGALGEYKYQNEITALLKQQRPTPDNEDSRFVQRIVSALETVGLNICQQLPVTVLCIIIETIIHADYCPESERGLYLVADSLCSGSLEEHNRAVILKKKIDIGKKCLIPLISKLVDDSCNEDLRRWIGILCVQLLRDSPENVDIVAFGPNDLRQSIGSLIQADDNEIIKVVCGKLVGVLKSHGIPLESLWPGNIQGGTLNKFPEHTPDVEGWSQQFQSYLDGTHETQNSSRPIRGLVYFAYKCEVMPTLPFGAHGHSYTIWFDAKKFIIQATSHEDCVDYILDVARGAILRIVLNTPESSQDGSQVTFHLKNSSKYHCYMNGQQVELETLRIFGQQQLTEDFRQEFLSCYNEVQLFNESHPADAIQLDAIIDDDDENPDFGTSHGIVDHGYGLEHFYITKSPIVLDAAHGNIVVVEHNAETDRVSKGGDDIENGYRTYISQPIVMHPGGASVKEVVNAGQGFHDKNIKQQQEELRPDAVTADSVGTDAAVNFNPEDDLYDATPPKSSAHTQQTRSEQSSQRSPGSLSGDAAENDIYVVAARGVPLPSKATTATQSEKTSVNKASRLVQEKSTIKKSSSKLLVANKVIKSKAKAPISVSQKTRMAKEISSKEINQNIEQKTTRSTTQVKNMVTENISDSLSSVDEHNASTPKQSKRPLLHSDAAVKAQGAKPVVKKKTKVISYGKPTISRRLTPPTRERSEASDVSVFDHLSDDGECQTAKRKSIASNANPRKTMKSKVQGKPKVATKSKSTVQNKKQSPKQDEETGDNSQNKRPRRNPIRNSQKSQDETIGIKVDEGVGEESVIDFVQEQTTLSVEAGTQRKSNDSESHTDVVARATADVESAPFDEHETLHQTKVTDQEIASVLTSQLQNTTNGRFQVMHDRPTVVETKLDKTTRVVDKNTDRHTMAQMLSQRLSGVVDEQAAIEQSADKSISTPRKPMESRPMLPNVSPKAALVSKLHKAQEETAPVHSTAAKTTVNSSVQPKSASSTREPPNGSSQLRESRKRKATSSEMSPSKETQSKRQSQGVIALRRSPRLKTQKKMEVTSSYAGKIPVSKSGRVQHPTALDQSTGILGTQTSSLVQPDATPTSKPQLRRSPRLLERAQSEERLSPTVLVGDSTCRKPKMIQFDKNGPKNQGITSAFQVAHEISNNKGSVAKRKLDGIEITSLGRPLKRQNSTPAQVEVEDHEEENMPPAFASSPPENEPAQCQPASPPKRIRSRHTSNSQGSRVTPNGSPKPAASARKVDHIGKIFGKSLEIPEPLDDQARRVATRTQLRSGSTPFGPMVNLGNRAKTRPTCSGEEETRYVAHYKTKSGQYENLQSKEIVTVGEMHNPFKDKEAPENPNGFNTILQKLTIAENSQKPIPQRKNGIEANIKNDRIGHDDERTLVSTSSTPSMSSGDSPQQLDAEMPASPSAEVSAEERWNVALRPHYRTFADAVHRVADDMIIRLQGEEDTLGLIVKQYQQNGNQMMKNVFNTRKQQKAQMVRGLLEKKRDILTTYNNSRELLAKTNHILKENSATDFEKQWKSKQAAIQENLAVCREGP